MTVHSLGAKATGRARVVAEDAAGRVLGSADVAPLAAPTDLRPHTVTVALKAGPSVARVRVEPVDGEPEVTLLNNVVRLPGR